MLPSRRRKFCTLPSGPAVTERMRPLRVTEFCGTGVSGAGAVPGPGSAEALLGGGVVGFCAVA